VEEFIREFENNGFRYRYEYKNIGFIEIQKACSLYNLHNEQVRKGFKSVRDLELSGMEDYQSKAFAHLLMRVLPDDSVERRTKENRDKCRNDARDFLDSLTGEQWSVLQECQADFFDRTGLVDAELLLQLTPFIESVQAGSQQTPKATGSVDSESNTSESNA
jgi:hypothetical protein